MEIVERSSGFWVVDGKATIEGPFDTLKKAQKILAKLSKKTPHTPGPWREGLFNETQNEAVTIHDSDGRPVADAYGFTEPGQPQNEAEAMANARLIAAAPELLKELERIHDELKPDEAGNRLIPAGFLNQTRAILKKAYGIK